ncbi:MAG TPA: VOC family protein [Thermoanaerobaculia bacterium]|jgi:catechol 2,3-dioxygenase-like lactoylglutathione lyase family enzyme|nr:VOC family protein [Thermoanaerobaculia bacterium]
MAVALTKDSIDLGIVVKDADAALRFYRDTLGFKDQGTMPMPGGGTMYRLLCGSSLIKLVALAQAPAAAAAPGGIQGGTGYRYWTISVSNLEDTANACATAGYKLAIKPREIRPGIRIAMIEDPDGNWVELLEVAQAGAAN